MKRTIFAAALFTAMAIGAGAVVDRPLTVRYGAEPEALVLRQANSVDVLVTLKQPGGAAVGLSTTNVPFFWWGEWPGTTSGVVTASCSVVSSTGGVFRASLTAAQLNYIGEGLAYGVGVVNSGQYDTAWIGTLSIEPDAMAAGVAGVITWTTNLNWVICTYVNTGTYGPYRFNATAYAGITTNADGSITIPAPVLSYTGITNAPWLVAASNLSDLASAATARTNLGLGSAATNPASAFATAAQGTNADTAYGWDNHATKNYRDMSQGTNVPSTWTNDQTAVVARGFGFNVSTGVTGNVKTYTGSIRESDPEWKAFQAEGGIVRGEVIVADVPALPEEPVNATKITWRQTGQADVSVTYDGGTLQFDQIAVPPNDLYLSQTGTVIETPTYFLTTSGGANPVGYARFSRDIRNMINLPLSGLDAAALLALVQTNSTAFVPNTPAGIAAAGGNTNDASTLSSGTLPMERLTTSGTNTAGVLTTDGVGGRAWTNAPTLVSLTVSNVIGGTLTNSVLTLQNTSATATGTPTAIAFQLGVNSNGATKAITVLNNGNMGAGTATPAVRWDIVPVSDGTTCVRSRYANGNASFIDIGYRTITANGGNFFDIGQSGTATAISIAANSDINLNAGTMFLKQSNGNVGIGTNIPNSKLHVAGVISLTSQTNHPAAYAGGGQLYCVSNEVYAMDSTGGFNVLSPDPDFANGRRVVQLSGNVYDDRPVEYIEAATLRAFLRGEIAPGPGLVKSVPKPAYMRRNWDADEQATVAAAQTRIDAAVLALAAWQAETNILARAEEPVIPAPYVPRPRPQPDAEFEAEGEPLARTVPMGAAAGGGGLAGAAAGAAAVYAALRKRRVA